MQFSLTVAVGISLALVTAKFPVETPFCGIPCSSLGQLQQKGKKDIATMSLCVTTQLQQQFGLKIFLQEL